VNKMEEKQKGKIPEWLFFAPVYFMMVGVMLYAGVSKIKELQWQIAFGVLVMIVYAVMYGYTVKKVKENASK